MIGIILASGRGSRMRNLTSTKPKTLLRYKNKIILEKIIENFEANNIKNIYITTGYKKNLFKDLKIKKIFNKNWNKTSIFESLYCARNILKKNSCIISYSDIWYEANAIKLLKNCKSQICILSNNNWRKYWQKRFKNPLVDLESFKIDKGNFLKEIGKKEKNIKKIEGQFSGLFKINPDGWNKIEKFIKFDGLKKNFSKDITNFFSSFIEKNPKMIKVVKFKSSWREFDNKKDLKI